MENGKYIEKEFRSDEDVLSVIDSIIEETKTANEEQGKSFDMAKSVSAQLPFFACKNTILNQKLQNDISRYVYCEKFHSPPYAGAYGDQPYIWIQKSNIIGSAINKKQKKVIENNNA